MKSSDNLKPACFSVEQQGAVAIVVANRNGLSHLKYSLPSLVATNWPNCTIVVSDNQSTDGSVEFVEANYPGCIIVRTSADNGFAGTINCGLRYALGQEFTYIAICNNDIIVRPEWVFVAISALSKNPSGAVVGFTEVLRQYGNTFHDWTYSAGGRLALTEVDEPPGCAFLCTTRSVRAVGLFDEGYYLYGEDNDFFWRLRKRGYVLYKTELPIWHYGENTSRQVPFRASWLAYRNALRFSIKNQNPVRWLRMILALLNQGCNPMLNRDATSPNSRRLRRYSIPVNFCLVAGSLLWNMWNLKITFSARNSVTIK
jgi:GT2 family glycosyltransferase